MELKPAFEEVPKLKLSGIIPAQYDKVVEETRLTLKTAYFQINGSIKQNSAEGDINARKVAQLFTGSDLNKLCLQIIAGTGKNDLLKNSEVRYSVDKEKIYSMMIYLNAKPYILTLRVSDKFTDLSLADRDGNARELLTQANGKITFEKMV